jgi:response regulator RpfG family c-di-GMP phosphodiesterase/DNA-binding CsgD family transcriptional regulator
MKSYKILIANDQNVDFLVISSYIKLTEDNIEIIRAENGLIAFEKAKEVLPDLIIMDWEMPELNGIESIRKLKADDDTKDIPVIMITAVNKSTENLNTAFNVGAIDFVRYPIDKIELQARIKSVLLLSLYYKEMVQAEKQARELLEEIIERKKIELSLLTLTSIHKRNLLSELKKQVDELSEANPEIRGINHIYSIIKSYEESESDWMVFEKHFEEIHNGFFERLEKTSVLELSQGERRFAAFIRSGLASDQIAKMMSISMEGVKKNRYRLRKKLGIETSESLDKIIESI